MPHSYFIMTPGFETSGLVCKNMLPAAENTDLDSGVQEGMGLRKGYYVEVENHEDYDAGSSQGECGNNDVSPVFFKVLYDLPDDEIDENHLQNVNGTGHPELFHDLLVTGFPLFREKVPAEQSTCPRRQR